MFYSLDEIVYAKFQTFISTGMARRAENVKCVYPSSKSCSKSLENLERIQRLVSVKPPMCHNTDTMWHTKNHIPRYTSLTTNKSIPKFSALRLKRSGQGTGYGERKKKTKGTEISTGPTASSRHSKNASI